MISTTDTGKLITCRIRKCSLKAVKRNAIIEDVNYVISGTGKALCNGKESIISAGEYHIFKKGTDYSIINAGNEDLVLLSFVKEA